MLTAVGQRLHPFGDERVEFGDRDRPVAQQISLAFAEPLDQRLSDEEPTVGNGECSKNMRQAPSPLSPPHRRTLICPRGIDQPERGGAEPRQWSLEVRRLGARSGVGPGREARDQPLTGPLGVLRRGRQWIALRMAEVEASSRS